MLLAVDTSTTRAGIALYDGDVLAEVVWQAGRDHGRHLMPVVEETMRRIGLQPADLTAIAAARGPGSFTGLRVGLSVAQGLAVALGVPAYGIGSLEVLAAGLPPLGSPVRAVLAAGRGRFATALFQADGGRLRQADEVVGVTLDSLLRLMVERCAIVGDLDAESRTRLAALGEHVWVAPPAVSVRRPSVLAELAWQRFRQGCLPGPDAGEPIYLSRG
ncbi:MAG TPA: tRNA (adenosine(37)-N6)-threonylcarbamoyltransferase complex dimerization subunit type 1 TsaB [Chloroflexota bacterium]|nr:tRNA (adenosine(37)-N6)-threonylcarbamoyltransferase complex dimerization subunit type 1 TsaB [Chloroflexota bacterium]